MRKRWLGIPMPITAVALALILAGGAVAGIMLTREIPSTVSIVVPYEMSVWEDEDCTVELTELPFGNIFANGNTDPLTFYLRNDGEYEQYIAMSQDGLDGEHLALNWEGVTEICPPDSFIFEYVLTEQVVEEAFDDWINSEATLTADMNGAAGESFSNAVPEVSRAIDAVMTASIGSPASFEAPCPFSIGDIIKIDNEVMKIKDIINDDASLIRGYGGTTMAGHEIGAIAYLQEVTIIPLDTELACSDGSAFSVGDEIKVDTEEMSISAIAGDTLTVTRGTPAAHTSGTAIFVWETIPEETIWVKVQNPLVSDASMPITLFLSADSGAEKGDVDFTTIVNASDIPY